jgi:predicted nucleic acid-binding protein
MGTAQDHCTRRAVLDTNVALALWLFDDPQLAPLRDALEGGVLLWTACPPMLDELLHELRPERCARYGQTVAVVQARLDRVPCLRLLDLSVSCSAPFGLRCRDPKDQMFIDLAVAERIPLLISRDRAVLKLRRKALAHGVTICTPESWVSGANAPPDAAVEEPSTHEGTPND